MSTHRLPLAQVISRRAIFDGRIIELSVERVRYPNGHCGDLEIVRHPGAAAVVPVTDDGQVVLVRQYRHAIGGWLLEVPAGKLDPGEAPVDCARRETGEEVALSPRTLVALGSIFPTPGFADERIWLFLGTDLEPVPGGLEPDEVIEVMQVPMAEAVALAAGAAPVGDNLRDAKSAIAILRAARHLGLD